VVRVKVCCIASIAEAEAAVAAGASLLGLVSAMPSGPGPIPDARIAEIARWAPLGVGTVLLTCRTEADAIAAQVREAGVGWVQLVDAVDPSVLTRLGRALPNVKRIQVVHVTGEDSVAEAVAAAEVADAVLLDSGDPRAAVKELGGTGRVHRWDLSAEVVRRVRRPVFLAGGLTPENAAEAVRTVRPFGLDVCSGLRPEGGLDPDRLGRFMAAAAAGAA